MSEKAEIEITANTSRLPAALRHAMRLMDGFATRAASMTDRVAMGPRRGLGMMGNVAAFNLAYRAVDALIDQGKGFLGFQEDLTRFGIAARQTPMQLAAIERAARGTSSAIGVDAREVLASSRAYADLAGAQNTSIAKMNILSRTAQASGATGKDLAGMMYQLTRSMKVTEDQMENTMGGLINQAKDGAIEARQMAQEFSGMMPIFARFGVTGREGAIQLGAMYQVTRDGFDSAAQASTGMIRLMAGLQRHASRFAKAGVHVFKPGSKSELREISDIMEQISNSPLANDTEALVKAFGRSEAWRTFQLLQESIPRLRELEAAGRANGVVQQDLATYAESAAGRMAIAFERMKNTVAAAFTPERIEKFVGAIEGLVDKIDPVIKGVETIGAVLGKFHSAGRAIRSIISDSSDTGNPWHGRSAAENRLDEYKSANWGRFVGPPRADKITPEMMEAAEKEASAIKFLRAGYDTTARNIIKLQGGEDAQPNQASIRAALQAKAAQGWAGAAGERAAGDRYLSNVPTQQLDEARNKAFQDQVAPLMKSLENTISETWGKNRPPTAREQAIAIRDAMYEARGMVVEIDGNPVAKASGNATDRRRRP